MNIKSLLALTVLVPGLVFGEGSDLAANNEANWRFDVYLDDKSIGWHKFGLRTAPNGDVSMTTQAEFDVKLLFVRVFSYEHQAAETWREGCLQNIDSSTRQNKKQFKVRGTNQGAGLVLTLPSISATPIRCAQSFAYWNPSILEASSLLNSQTGLVEDVTVTQNGETSLDIGGKRLRASEFTITTLKGDIRVWYEVGTNRWLALEAPAKGGRKLRYKAVELPEPGLDPILELAGGASYGRALSTT